MRWSLLGLGYEPLLTSHSTLFLLTFWELKLYDIQSPKAGYAATIQTIQNADASLKAQLNRHDLELIEVSRRLLPSATDQAKREQQNQISETKRNIAKTKAAIPRLHLEVLPQLEIDRDAQEKHVAKVIARCKREKNDWLRAS